MNEELFHKQKRKEVLSLCKELKSAYGSDWVFVMPVLFPDQFTYLKQINKIKHYDRRRKRI